MGFEVRKLSEKELAELSDRLEKLNNQELLAFYDGIFKALEHCEEQMRDAMHCVAVGGYPEDHNRLLNELPIVRTMLEKRMSSA